jgi:hypothetical protein
MRLDLSGDTALWLRAAPFVLSLPWELEVVHLRRTRLCQLAPDLSATLTVSGVCLVALFPNNLVYCSGTMATMKLCAETLHLHWASGTELLGGKLCTPVCTFAGRSFVNLRLISRATLLFLVSVWRPVVPKISATALVLWRH